MNSQPSAPPLLVLWDVDHTLIENSGVSKETYAAAFELLTGRPADHPAVTEGRTDLSIMRDLFSVHGVELATAQAGRWEEALGLALSRKQSALRARGYALPGVLEALTSLANAPNVVQSVLTGNVRANAVGKTAAFELDRFLDFEIGGYGADDPDRWNLVPVAQKRASAKYGSVFDVRNTVLIGDTPRDVEAGRLGGAQVVAVVTGAHSEGELRQAGASVVLSDLRETSAVVAAVLASRAEAFDSSWALTQAERLLAPLGNRWLHIREVGEQALRLSAAVPEGERELLVTAALLHDIGYAPELAHTGFHPLDGARWLRSLGVDARLCGLVAHHFCAVVEAEQRGLVDVLLAEFPREESPLADALTCSDATVGPMGSVVTVEQRLSEILTRYEPGHFVHTAVTRAAPELREIVRRTLARLPSQP